MSIPTRIILLLALCVLALLCWQMIGCDGVGAAPAPLLKDRDAMPDSMVGDWIIEWGGSNYVTKLSADGSYSCYLQSGSMSYYGVWTLRGRTLWVFEAMQGCNSAHWQVRLDRDMRGTSNNHIKIRLRRPR